MVNRRSSTFFWSPIWWLTLMMNDGWKNGLNLVCRTKSDLNWFKLNLNFIFYIIKEEASGLKRDGSFDYHFPLHTSTQ